MARETVEYNIPTDLDDIPDGTTYKKMTSTEQTKLTGIEENATIDQSQTDIKTLFSWTTSPEDGATDDQSGAEIKTAYEGETDAFTDTKNTKLTGIEDSATGDQTGIEIQSAVTGLADGDRVLVASEPLTGEKKVYGIHINASGNIETDQDTTPEA